MGKDKGIGGPFERGDKIEFSPDAFKPEFVKQEFGKAETPDPQAPPGLEDELSLDVHGKAETVMAEEGGSQVLGDEVDMSGSETAICSETAIIMDFLALPEADEGDESLKKVSDENLTSAPESKDK